MSRAIKFRVWDAYLKRLSGPEGLAVTIRNGVIEGVSQRTVDGATSTEWGSAQHPLDQERYKLMQYTGLLDKNGAAIYEGDVVEETLLLKGPNGETVITRYQVRWGSWCYVAARLGSNTSCGAIDAIHARSVMEVIGNIYQHSELLQAHI